LITLFNQTLNKIAMKTIKVFKHTSTILFVIFSISLSVAAQPDLYVTFLSVTPSSVKPGESVEVKYKIRNNGNTAANNFYVRLYLSSNSTISTSDTYLNHEQSITFLTANTTSNTYTATVTIPENTSDGTKYLGCIVDYNHLIAETNENNNTRATAITVKRPDLYVTYLSINPATANPGESVQVTYQIRNQGDADVSGNFRLRLYLSNNTTITTSDRYLNHQRTFSSLAANTTSPSYSATVTIPADADEGTKYIGCIVDYDLQINETNENNNTRATAITVNPLPDLYVTSLSINPASANTGENVQVTYQIRNQGNADVSHNFSLRLYLSSNTTITTSDRYLNHQRTFSYLAANTTSSSYTATVTIPADAGEGTKYIGCIVDYNYLITETNENNNERAAAITLCEALPELSDISGEISVCENSRVTYSIESVTGATSYTWTLPDSWTGDSQSNSITCTTGTAGGTIYLVATNACGNSSPEKSLDISILSQPEPEITQTDDILHSNATEGNQWYNQNGIIDGETEQDLKVTENGSYYVIVTNKCGSATSNTINVTITSLNNIKVNNRFKVYPNPAENRVYLTLTDDQLTNSKALFINTKGKIVKQEIINSKESTFDISNLPKGVYFIKIINKKTTGIQKLILK